MALAQLNIKLPPTVLTHWREMAAAAGHESVRDWLLEITGTPSAARADLPLRDRVAQLEAAVEALQQARPAPRRVDAPPAPNRPAPRPAAPPPAPSPDAPAGAITTAELAERTGTNRAAWNNWARSDRIGAIREHPTAGSWRLAGKASPPAGGPARWVWEPAGT